jgi:mannose-6-phosphate isomerase-like protein (cupin superfamily)
MPYVLAASSSPSFALKGLTGYEFQALRHQDIAVHLLDVRKGHDTFIISNALTRIYYIIEGTGVFTIGNQKYNVVPGLLVEVPPGVEYSYSGSMKIFLVSHPRWFEGNERTTRNNPDLVSEVGLVGLIGNKLRRYLHRNREENVQLEGKLPLLDQQGRCTTNPDNHSSLARS